MQINSSFVEYLQNYYFSYNFLFTISTIIFDTTSENIKKIIINIAFRPKKNIIFKSIRKIAISQNSTSVNIICANFLPFFTSSMFILNIYNTSDIPIKKKETAFTNPNGSLSENIILLIKANAKNIKYHFFVLSLIKIFRNFSKVNPPLR